MICLCLSYMANLKNFCQQMLVYNSMFIPKKNLDFVMFKIQLPIVQKSNKMSCRECSSQSQIDLLI
jgi:hypothetical protein